MKPAPRRPHGPDFVVAVYQSGIHGDCGVAALAMLCSATYEEALAAFTNPMKVLAYGVVTWAEMEMAATRLMTPVKLLRTYDLEKDTGVLHVHPTRSKKKDDHLVFLWAGRVIEGNGELWKDPAAYLRRNGYKALGLMVRAD